MIQAGIVLFEFLGLFLLSRRVTQSLFTLFLIISNRPVAVSLVSVLLFPGTVIHELSHLFTAEVLGVKTGKLTLIPESIDNEQVHAGTVEIQRTDPVRRYIIGLAPIGVGLIILSALSYFLPQLINTVQLAINQGILFRTPAFYLLLGTFYLFFVVSNTMFSSKEDVHGIGPFIIVILLVAVAAYASGIRINLTGSVENTTITMMEVLTRVLGMVIIFNLVILVIVSIFFALLKKILRKKIHRPPERSVN